MPYGQSPPDFWGRLQPEHWESATFCWMLSENEFRHRTLSQCGQDLIVVQLMHLLCHPESIPLFLDFGANTGNSESSTELLEIIGWQGLLVEPNLGLSSTLLNTRTSPLVAAALGSVESISLLITSSTAHKLGSLEQNITDHQLVRLNQQTSSEKSNLIRLPVPVLPMKYFLDFFKVLYSRCPDFLKIDIEGGELQAIKMLFDLPEYRPKFIEIENNTRSSACAEVLGRMGYDCLFVLDSFVEIWGYQKNQYRRDIITSIKFTQDSVQNGYRQAEKARF